MSVFSNGKATCGVTGKWTIACIRTMWHIHRIKHAETSSSSSTNPTTTTIELDQWTGASGTVRHQLMYCQSIYNI
jgi:hypothetical protein